MIIVIKKWKEDNEYFEVQYDTDTKKYYSCFTDVQRKYQRVEIEKKVVPAYIKASKIAKKFENEYSRHIEHSEIFENNLNIKAMDKPLSLEDEIIRKSTFEEVRNAIEQLPEIQKRRIKDIYFNDLTQQQLADKECTSLRAIQYSLHTALENLKKILKK
ncbi:MAG: hypothetical protein U0M92_03430 [Bacilli bacterium]|jgi:RNA polymerase ECF-type sigma factor